jgi:hypothetical protein
MYNKNFESLDDLEEAFCQRCDELQRNPELVKGTIGFNWWVKAVNDLK